MALCLFNLIPLAPLDGSGVFFRLVGKRGAQALASLQTYGPILLMGLFMMSYISPRFDIMGGILSQRGGCGHAFAARGVTGVAWLHRAVYRVRQFGKGTHRHTAGRWREAEQTEGEGVAAHGQPGRCSKPCPTTTNTTA